MGGISKRPRAVKERRHKFMQTTLQGSILAPPLSFTRSERQSWARAVRADCLESEGFELDLTGWEEFR